MDFLFNWPGLQEKNTPTKDFFYCLNSQSSQLTFFFPHFRRFSSSNSFPICVLHQYVLFFDQQGVHFNINICTLLHTLPIWTK